MMESVHAIAEAKRPASFLKKKKKKQILVIIIGSIVYSRSIVYIHQNFLKFIVNVIVIDQ